MKYTKGKDLRRGDKVLYVYFSPSNFVGKICLVASEYVDRNTALKLIDLESGKIWNGGDSWKDHIFIKLDLDLSTGIDKNNIRIFKLDEKDEPTY